MKVLYAASEAAPFVKTGGLADVAGSLPKALSGEGADIRVILPLYASIAERWRLKMNFCFYTYIEVAWRRQYCGVFSLDHDGVIWYFIDNEYYFKRGSVYGCYDDGERFAFFSKAVTAVLPRLGWQPEVIHCNDWQTALIPLYAGQDASADFDGIKTVFTIHNIEYQGRFGKEALGDVFGLSDALYQSGILRCENGVSLMKGAIYRADHVTTVSPSYAAELKDPYYACGLHEVIADNAYKLTGILNGLDTAHYDPAKDPLIGTHYSPENPAGKTQCRAALSAALGLGGGDAPVIACVSRLVGHKGFDLVAEALDRLVSRSIKLVILGTGEERFERFFREAENRYKGTVSANIMYSERRASLVYAGADMLLMPSKSEPCGLSQMIAMRYGTLPIVHEVGGLKDTVRPYPGADANGFSFLWYSADDMLQAIDRAIEAWRYPEKRRALILRGMREDLSWTRSAKTYIALYHSLIQTS
ncbi:MAG: glycogen synthase [Oscillospiraceae bacterium]|jgi:starch synthase|nr:glycogen synthase [Oscillospiraceae bacterium]